MTFTPLIGPLVAVLLVGCMVPGALARADTQSAAHPQSASDALNQIHHINQKEILLAKLALQKTQNPQVISFANRMIKDHTAADSKTVHLARIDDITLQNFAPSSDEKVAMNRLASLNGGDFDAAYMDAMKSGHQEALQYLTSTQKTMENKGVKSLISKLIPAVRHHEQMATNIAANVNQNQREAAGQVPTGAIGEAAGQAGGQTNGQSSGQTGK